MKHGLAPLALTALLGALGCSGVISDAEDSPGAPGTHTPLPADLECGSPEDALADGSMRRLTRDELINTYRAIFPPAALADFRVWLDAIPADTTRHSPAEFSPDTSAEHVDGMFEATSRLAAAVAHDDGLLEAMAPGCMLQTRPDDGCVRAFVAATGAKAMRRELEANEVDQYVDAYEGGAAGATAREGIELFLTALANDPELIFHVRDREGGALTPRALASRIAYAAAGAPPDAELVVAAEAGELTTVEGRAVHARRLLDSPAGRRHVRQLFTRWLGLHGRHSPENAAQLAGVEVDGLYDELREETLDFVEHVVFEERGDLRALMTSQVVFPTTERLAAIFGTEVSEEPIDVGGRRAGVLTRPAVLISDNPRTSPILRGLFVWERLLCQGFGAPPNDADAIAEEALASIDADHSTSRTRTQAMTGAPRCQTCHAKINAPGFALAHFGPLGGEWEREVVFAAPGEVLAELPLGDDATVHDLPMDDGPRSVEGAADLASTLAASGRGQMCLALQVFRTTHLRDPAEADACHFRALVDSAADASLFELLVQNAAGETIRLGPATPAHGTTTEGNDR